MASHWTLVMFWNKSNIATLSKSKTTTRWRRCRQWRLFRPRPSCQVALATTLATGYVGSLQHNWITRWKIVYYVNGLLQIIWKITPCTYDPKNIAIKSNCWYMPKMHLKFEFAIMYSKLLGINIVIHVHISVKQSVHDLYNYISSV